MTGGLDAPPRESGLRGRLVNDPQLLGDELVEALGPYPLEVFLVFPLDEDSRIIECTLVAVGSADRVTFPARAVWDRAIALGASKIVMLHTHPMGGLTPTVSDLAQTRRHLEVGRNIGLELVDHLIIDPEACRSLRQSTDLWLEQELKAQDSGWTRKRSLASGFGARSCSPIRSKSGSNGGASRGGCGGFSAGLSSSRSMRPPRRFIIRDYRARPAVQRQPR